MRRSKAETAETRRNIVKTAGIRFRQNGICETGLADLMESAGLTHGGFYRHFASKDQLISEASADAFAANVAEMEAAASTVKGRKALEAIADAYLSPEHRKDRAHGCPLAALGSEFARSEKSTRSVATEGILKMIAIVAERLKDPNTVRAKKSASVFVATMLGALTISRIVADPKVSSEILAATRAKLSSWE
ncbi:TetR/AcrR family transcriptional regulator [Bradyrhizobium iriomotense]|uniref:TetR family transcriptional regulator n=1 Tax=Bradyrhizobium iriomotense TaxID=441950 RepID=A0ABQ6B7Z3_9BRAD|nr:TetR/AcrR family transcriptional regulator [Bradyrhizobium iriomotense]GLR90539.1 TetR family transcriptional regulator [Bradyrhizobium iriomotense]